MEIAWPSNAIQDLRAKAHAYLDATAAEAWIVFPRSRRIEFYDKAGTMDHTRFKVDLSRAFE